MASLKDTEQLAQNIEELVKELRSELKDGSVDFQKLASISDEISEQADGMAETFSSVNDALMQRIDQAKGGSGTSRPSNRRQESKAGSGGS
jgi:methyl-accepting chemotaxis protein